MARLQKKSRRQSPQVQPDTPAFPARWSSRLYAISPVSGLLATVALGVIIPQDLAPASGRQDHAISRPRPTVRPHA